MNMDYPFSLQAIKDADLTPTYYFFLLSLYTEEEYQWEVPHARLRLLERDGWIKITSEGVVLRSKFKSTFISFVGSDDIKHWIQDWRTLWPQGHKIMGRLCRGDKQGCLKKMKRFMKNNPEYNKEDILEASRVYIFSRQVEQWKGLICADYFIEKNGVSQLAAHLEDIEGREAILAQMNQGGGTFHKEV